MAVTLIEYTVSRHERHGWIIRRNGLPLCRRQKLLLAVSFATHLAERESILLSGAARISIGQIDV
ncbi:hypothetical protein [Dyella humicola]|uniref:hypothetical protein n=1 Tax=Dyella humicola TaxID=2992126 RepID=UPI00225733D5|nr:hypothetical protein [Dyella humicola]